MEAGCAACALHHTHRTAAVLAEMSVPNSMKQQQQKLKALREKQEQQEQASDSDTGSESSDFADDDDGQESKSDYKKGGYHPVRLGDTYHQRYTVERKLGWGHFSTVWLASDKYLLFLSHFFDGILDSRIDVPETNLTTTLTNSWLSKFRRAPNHTPKQQKMKSNCSNAFVPKIRLIRIMWSSYWIILRCKAQMGVVRSLLSLDVFNVRYLIECFADMCMVFEVLGDSSLKWIQRYHHRGLPLPLVQALARQALTALAFLHEECKIVHTDIKPENLILMRHVPFSLPQVRSEREVELVRQRLMQSQLGLTKSQKKRLKAKQKKATKFDL
jgi:serine/threonine-protein kinase SRPK3